MSDLPAALSFTMKVVRKEKRGDKDAFFVVFNHPEYGERWKMVMVDSLHAGCWEHHNQLAGVIGKSVTEAIRDFLVESGIKPAYLT